MKTIKCSQVGGGTCLAEFTAKTSEEMKRLMTEHAKKAHPEMMEAATPESMAEWETLFDKVWSETPEDA